MPATRPAPTTVRWPGTPTPPPPPAPTSSSHSWRTPHAMAAQGPDTRAGTPAAAQAIVNQPELLLLDEPTAGLDPEQRVAFRALLPDLGERATVIVSTHLVEDVGAACTEVALMDAGKIVFYGTPAELTARGEGARAAGDAPLERGYCAALAESRS